MTNEEYKDFWLKYGLGAVLGYVLLLASNLGILWAVLKRKG